jgi:hypothetical protein
MSQDETTTTENTEVEAEETEPVEQPDHLELPDDHPLVKTLAKQRAELKELKKSYSQANKELDEYRQSQLTEQERLVAKTQEETKKAVRLEFAEKLVEAELKNALKGRHLAGDSVLEFNKSSFIDDGGDIDSEAIATWVEAHSTQAEAPKPDLGQGARGVTSSQAIIRSRDELANMSPDEILKARKDGRLDMLMGKL